MSLESLDFDRDMRAVFERDNARPVKVVLTYRGGGSAKLTVEQRVYREMRKIKDSVDKVPKLMKGYDVNGNNFDVNLGETLLALTVENN